MVNTTGDLCTNKRQSVIRDRKRKNNKELVETMYNEKKILEKHQKNDRKCEDRWEDR